MSVRDLLARRGIVFARDHFRGTWVHRLAVTGWVYDVMFSAVAKPEQVQFRGITLKVDQSDTTITPTLLTGQYECTELDFLESVLSSGMTVIDVGANNGAYTCIASRLVGGTGTVIAFEPVAENLEALRESLRLNLPVSDNVVVIPAAAGDKCRDSLRIYLDEGNSGTHSAGVVGASWQTVPVRTLDEVVCELALEALDLVKIDVEGFEPQVLDGSRVALERFEPILLCEFDVGLIQRAGGDPDSFAGRLFEYGMVLEIDERNRSLVEISQARCARLRNSNVLVVPAVRTDACFSDPYPQRSCRVS